MEKFTPNSNYNLTPFNKELLLGFDNFSNQAAYSDMQALAKLFQNILIFKQGNFPNQPELGVGIEDYLFELATEETLSALRQKIVTQCNRFAPTDYTYDVTLDVIKDDNKKNTLAIYFYISKYSKEKGEPDIGMLFQGRADKSILSQIYLQ